MGKGGSVMGSEVDGEESLNSGEPPWPLFGAAERRVLDHQRKLHRWARADPARRFGDVFNLIYDRATLVVAWEKGGWQQGRDDRGRGQDDAPARRGGHRGRAVPGGVTLLTQGRHVHPAAGAADDDSQTQRQGSLVGDTDAAGPGGADGRQADPGTDFRGGRSTRPATGIGRVGVPRTPSLRSITSPAALTSG